MEREPDHVNPAMDRSFLTADIGDVVDSMTLNEKIQLLAGDGWWHTFAYPRLNIPSIKVTDGPAGARGGSAYNMTPATSFPNATCVGATFDKDLAFQMGQTLAAETKARGAVCLLAPTINIQRSPLGGRAFESYAEDPTLSGVIAGSYVQGLQGAGVSAAIKHFVCNDQEHDRMGQNSIVPPRALREVYLRPFQIAHKMAQPWGYMTSYAKLNGTHCAEHDWLLEELLRGEWKHEGIVMSDWTGTYSVSEAINAGLDIEFPGPARWRNKDLVGHLVTAHKIDPRQIDTLATHILTWVQKLAQKNEEVVYGEKKGEVTRWEAKEVDSALVRRIITEGIVLLKNDEQILPVRKGKVAIIGPNAKAKVFTGGGSARLNPAWSSTPWQGLVSEKPDGVDLSYAVGTLTAKYAPLLDENFTASDGSVGFDAYHYPITADGKQAEKHVASDILTRSEMRFNNFQRSGLGDNFFTELKATFTSPVTGEYEFALTCTGKFWFFFDGKQVLDMSAYKEKGQAFYGNGSPEAKVRVKVQEGKKYAIRVLHDTRGPPLTSGSSTLLYIAMRIGAEPAYEADQAIEEAVALAESSDTAIVVCGLNQDWESEGDDRPDLNLPMRSNELIERIAAANPNTIVVLQGGSALAMPWLSKVRGVVQAWYGGCETGTGIADIVYGKVNPSGRLPVTFPAREEDVPSYLAYKSADTNTRYEEGIWVGYKHYNARNIAPLFPFGHGLSYTTFEYSDLAITSVSKPKGTSASEWQLKAKVKVTNTGKVAGSHSVHFYTQPPAEGPMGLKHPERTLQAFAKVHGLQPGKSEVVEVTLDKYAISHWDERFNIWRAEPGTWGLVVGYDASRTYGQERFEVGKGLSWSGL